MAVGYYVNLSNKSFINIRIFIFIFGRKKLLSVLLIFSCTKGLPILPLYPFSQVVHSDLQIQEGHGWFWLLAASLNSDSVYQHIIS